LLKIVTNFEESLEDLTYVQNAKTESDKQHYIQQLKKRLNTNQYKMSNACAYLKDSMMTENIKAMSQSDVFQATIQAQAYYGLIA